MLVWQHAGECCLKNHNFNYPLINFYAGKRDSTAHCKENKNNMSRQIKNYRLAGLVFQLTILTVNILFDINGKLKAIGLSNKTA